MPEQAPPVKMKGEIEFFIEERQDDHVTARMPVTPGMLNPYGIVHAGPVSIGLPTLRPRCWLGEPSSPAPTAQASL